ncbi:MAG TPA: amidohydrolase [Nocardioidaceae bacterium]|nr:amidohydrolase [Nocardioidaceae bacterium]
MSTLLLRGGRPWGHDAPTDVFVQDGVIRSIGPSDDAADVEVDAAGRLILPGLVDAHCHLDKTLFGGPWVPHPASDALADRIATERRLRSELGIPDVERITDLLTAMVAGGTTSTRSHVDVAPELGLTGVEAVREAIGRIGGRIDVQLVAFPQYGILSAPRTAELMETALADGVEGVGGIDPAGMDGDPARHLDIVFDLAERHGAMVDIHLHDGGSLGVWELELICERTSALGLHGRVAVSHAYALGQATPAEQDRVAERIAGAGVTITTAAVYDFPVAPVKRLRAAGANVACGHDGIRDLWGPYGSGDMLDRTMHLAYRNTFRRDDDIELALEAATHGGAVAIGRRPYGETRDPIAVGDPADLVVVPASTPAEAVVARPTRDLVVKGGRVVARDGVLS